MNFTFGKGKVPRPPLTKTVQSILEAKEDKFPQGWYFVGCVHHPPVRSIINGEVKCIIQVSSPDYPGLMKVVLSESVVKEYLPQTISIDDMFVFKDGTLIFGEEQNHVEMNQGSKVSKWNSSMEVKSDSVSKAREQNQRTYSQINCNQNKEEESKSLALNQSSSMMIGNVSSPVNRSNNRRVQSVRVGNKSQTILPLQIKEYEIAQFTGRVLSMHDVGRGTNNNGRGYKVQLLADRSIYEVVIWRQVFYLPTLINGNVYHFKFFKVNHRCNYPISFYFINGHSLIDNAE